MRYEKLVNSLSVIPKLIIMKFTVKEKIYYQIISLNLFLKINKYVLICFKTP